MPLLKIVKLTFSNNPSSNKSERNILSAIDCELSGGEFIGLIGANGAGKTTLLRLLMGLLQPTRGDVLINQKPLRYFSKRALARQITLVPQDTEIHYPFSVREMVAMGRHPYLRRFAALNNNDLTIIDNAMHCLEVDTLADRPINSLSGGERQRVLIARAIAQQTSIILLDEATANLDLCHQLDVLNAGKKLAKQGHLVIAAIHDLTMASRFCDRLLLLADGALMANGTPDEVLTRARLRDCFSVDASVRRSEDVAGLTITPLYSLT